MNASTLFEWTNGLALLSWIGLLTFPYKQWMQHALLAVSVTLLCVIYGTLVFGTFDPNVMNDFSSLEGVMSLFTNPWAVTTGWIHYLAFDLMVGLYIVTHASKSGINPWLIRPSLLFTFMFGPLGLLSYLITRLFYTQTHFDY